MDEDFNDILEGRKPGDDIILQEYEERNKQVEEFPKKSLKSKKSKVQNDDPINNDSEDDKSEVEDDEGGNWNKEDEAIEAPGRRLPKPRKLVLNPQPKLDEVRLTQTEGIRKIPELFESIKFKGKGYEKEDLDKILFTLEYWANRLYPKFTFETFLERCETLGTKKVVRFQLDKIRHKISLNDEEIIENKEEDEEESVPIDPEAVFDAILKEKSPDNEFDRILDGYDFNMQGATTTREKEFNNSNTQELLDEEELLFQLQDDL